jgi:hypothetical protein
MSLQRLHHDEECALYQLPGDEIRELVCSTPETRAICNDPFVCGVDYTQRLRAACARVFQVLADGRLWEFDDARIVVLNILRGGLNFGLREALHEGVGCRYHNSAFVSAQRARSSANPKDWVITEDAYQKLSLRGPTDLVFGDVVATGTSLEHAVGRVVTTAVRQRASIDSILFFTIGSTRSSAILRKLVRRCRERFPAFRAAAVVYFEGVFQKATADTAMSIKIEGTDLLRAGGVLAPEFLESQYESPSYPIERCTIYDAGSRAFDLAEYFADVRGYWEANLELAADGMTYEQLLRQRMPEIDVGRFGDIDLTTLARTQLARIPAALPVVAPHGE